MLNPIKIKIKPDRPCIKVPKVWVLYAVFTSNWPNWETTQKYESLTCETVIDPHPNDKIAQTFPISESSSSSGKRGNIIADVVIIETVEDPWADFITDAIINGIKIPKLELISKDLTKVFIFKFSTIKPIEPPTLVINKIGAAIIILFSIIL